jgi:hypothetical protein
MIFIDEIVYCVNKSCMNLFFNDFTIYIIFFIYCKKHIFLTTLLWLLGVTVRANYKKLNRNNLISSKGTKIQVLHL